MKTLGLILLTVGAAACAKAEAQATASDPLGPIRCYAAADSAGLTSLSARQLCGGAQSDAPAQCFRAADAGNQLSETQSMALCYGASSNEPADCAVQLAVDGKLANQTIVNQCAARGTGVVRSSDVPACMDAGRSQLRLSDYELAELCSPGSTTVGNF
jgi:hypothetical protein